MFAGQAFIMFTEIILFDLTENPAEALQRLRCDEMLWRKAPDLLHAQFLHDEPAGAAGVAYIWRNREAAQGGHDADWRAEIAAAFGPPRITEVGTPDYSDREAPWPEGALAAA